jgi:hypothetical protein
MNNNFHSLYAGVTADSTLIPRPWLARSIQKTYEALGVKLDASTNKWLNDAIAGERGYAEDAMPEGLQVVGGDEPGEVSVSATAAFKALRKRLRGEPDPDEPEKPDALDRSASDPQSSFYGPANEELKKLRENYRREQA